MFSHVFCGSSHIVYQTRNFTPLMWHNTRVGELNSTFPQKDCFVLFRLVPLFLLFTAFLSCDLGHGLFEHVNYADKTNQLKQNGVPVVSVKNLQHFQNSELEFSAGWVRILSDPALPLPP